MSQDHTYPKLHNAAWPGLVGKEEGTENPPIPFEQMLEWTANAEVNGQRFDGIDLFLSLPHTDIDSTKDDLKQLADVFFTHAHGKEAMVRIETTIDDGCRRYHVDRSRLRLLSTYRGPGTEWLTNEQVDRHNLRSGAPNEEIVRFGQPNRMAPFWVGLFKGSLYPNMADSGLVHRSPPIDGTGQFRVRFCLDC